VYASSHVKIPVDGIEILGLESNPMFAVLTKIPLDISDQIGEDWIARQAPRYPARMNHFPKSCLRQHSKGSVFLCPAIAPLINCC
jgi:hypothetical protein